MNTDLQKLFTRFYNPQDQACEPMRGASSMEMTKKIRDELWPLFEQIHESRRLSLWHRDQLKDLTWQLPE